MSHTPIDVFFFNNCQACALDMCFLTNRKNFPNKKRGEKKSHESRHVTSVLSNETVGWEWICKKLGTFHPKHQSTPLDPRKSHKATLHHHCPRRRRSFLLGQGKLDLHLAGWGVVGSPRGEVAVHLVPTKSTSQALKKEWSISYKTQQSCTKHVKDTPQNSYKNYQFQEKNTLQGGTHKDERNTRCRFTLPNFHTERKNYAYKKEFKISYSRVSFSGSILNFGRASKTNKIRWGPPHQTARVGFTFFPNTNTEKCPQSLLGAAKE